MASKIYDVIGTTPDGKTITHTAIAWDEKDAIDSIVNFYEPTCFPVGTTWEAKADEPVKVRENSKFKDYKIPYKSI